MAEQSVSGVYGSMAGAEEAVRVLDGGGFPAGRDNRAQTQANHGTI
jgi:hypothetical protein